MRKRQTLLEIAGPAPDATPAERLWHWAVFAVIIGAIAIGGRWLFYDVIPRPVLNATWPIVFAFPIGFLLGDWNARRIARKQMLDAGLVLDDEGKPIAGHRSPPAT